MSSSAHRRRTSRTTKLIGAAAASALAVGGGLAVAGSAMATRPRSPPLPPQGRGGRLHPTSTPPSPRPTT
ncbi:hypothetical protein O1L55_42995 [Streptomyces albulus]|nr:hypothetical protein [Streptomyces noursei]